MFKIERMQKIREYMYQHKQADVNTLSALLNVSGATIRKDFEDLEKEGFITRFHGGASLSSASYQHEKLYYSFHNSDIQYDQDKEELGAVASFLIQEREWIFLGPGTTAFYIAKALAKRSNIYVMTNNLLAANILALNPTIQTIVIGGKVHSDAVYTIPENIEKELDNIYLSKAFFSIDGADLQAGYTLSDISVLDIINTVSSKCCETFLAVDSSKYGKRTFMKLADMSFSHSVITNDRTLPKYKQFYSANSIPVYTISSLNINFEQDHVQKATGL